MIARSALFAVILLQLATLTSCGGASGSAGGGSTTGKAGSLSRFAISGDRLYTLNAGNLVVFDIRQPSDPIRRVEIPVGRVEEIETIQAHGNLLLIGSTTGLYIYDTVNPDQPRWRSRLLHAVAKDPVVARGDTAFLTTSGTQNQLDVIDISNPDSPRLLRSYPMKGPTGLGVDGQYLFVCDGSDGVKVFDSRDPMDLVEVDRTWDLRPMDLIVQEGLLVATTEGGVVQYSYKTLPMKWLSRMGFAH